MDNLFFVDKKKCDHPKNELVKTKNSEYSSTIGTTLKYVVKCKKCNHWWETNRKE
jgi:hypothetical protein